MTVALEAVMWLSLGLLVYTQLGYGVLLAVLDRLLPGRARRRGGAGGRARAGAARSEELPSVSLIVAAHDEQGVIAAKVADARAQDYPAGRLEVVVACDGCSDDTARRAREAGADLVLELPRGGKIRAQDAGVERSSADIVAFSDANASWRPDALRRLVTAFEQPGVGYACGRLRFVRAVSAAPESTAAASAAPGSAAPESGGPDDPVGQPRRGRLPNQEGVYWRYELALRARESRLASITAGNGAIYATRREAYLVVDPIMGHDLSLPFKLVQRGWRAVYMPDAVATEKMVPTLEGEYARKRRMMSHTWPIVLRGGMLRLHAYRPLYALMIVSHRLLRYVSPALHVLALATNAALLGHGPVYVATFALQAAVLAAAALAGVLRWRVLLIARYYVLTTASLAAGLWDWRRRGTDAAWEAAEGTR